MREDFLKIKFGDIFELPVKNGIYKSPEFQGRGISIINMGELFNYQFIGNQEMNLVELNEKEYQSNSLENGDLLFARRSVVEDGAGKVSIIKNANKKLTFESSIIRVRLNSSRAFPLFYYYYFSSSLGKAIMSAITSGTNVKGIKGSDLKSRIIVLPPLETQKKIAAILSGYDDLIENNLKRIKILEEMAQQTYEEWFVRMRFPGYESATINKETGLPEGWEKVELGDLGEIITGKTPATSKEEYYNGDIPFIKTPDMNDSVYVVHTNQYLTRQGSDIQRNKILDKNDLVVSCIGSAGAYALVSKPSQFNQQINAIRFKKDELVFFTFCYAKGLKEILEALGSNGATMTNVNKGKFEQIEIVLPDEDLLNKFHQFAKPCFDNILNLQNQNQRLREARDILLPRLMMGMIEV